MTTPPAWTDALLRPDDRFFTALAARFREVGGPHGATAEALTLLLGRIDWEGLHPQLPVGPLGLRAAWRLESFLPAPRFQRLLATHLHLLTLEPRAGDHALGDLPPVPSDLAAHAAEGESRAAFQAGSALPMGEVLGILGPLAAPDMAHLGHKAIFLHQGSNLAARTDGLPAMPGLLAWLVAMPPVDRFWADRVARRMPDAPSLAEGASVGSPETHRQWADDTCALGLVGLLDAWTGWLQEAITGEDVRTALALAAADRLMDARRELTPKTVWLLLYLAALSEVPSLRADARVWVQAAALVNFFPGEEPEDRIQPRSPREGGQPSCEGLRDAMLDGLPEEALWQATGLLETTGPEAVLAEAAWVAAECDPAPLRACHALAAAAVADLLPQVAPHARGALVLALVKVLADTQGTCDLSMKASRSLLPAGGI